MRNGSLNRRKSQEQITRGADHFRQEGEVVLMKHTINNYYCETEIVKMSDFAEV